MLEDWQHGGFGLYVHWPFCQAKCPYCDFNSHVVKAVDQKKWLDAFISEIDRNADITRDKVLHSIFFGGGTPSLMDPDIVEGVIAKARSVWRTTNAPEITLEANPTSVEAGRFKAYSDAGVNRISMGVQALNDDDLRRLGRLHSAKEAMAAFETARRYFDRVSFDLIYARQGQTRDAWEQELQLALDLAVDHLSLYQLTIEEGTAFGDRYAAGKLRDLPSEDLAADLFDMTQEICAAAGYPAYEVSNHAVPGAESAHNKVYWKYGDYLGIGPGAHGRVTVSGQRFTTETARHPDAWLERVQRYGNGETSRHMLSTEDQATEFLLMGLRLSEGVDLSRHPSLMTEVFLDKINDLESLRYVRRNGNQLSVTPTGRPVLNAILRELLAG